MEQNNVTVYHTLREGNQCEDFMAKLGASSDTELFYHSSPPDDLLNLLRMDADVIFFSRDYSFLCLFSVFPFALFPSLLHCNQKI